jgi:transcriptional regulator with PAS, ATPase and Fis domain
MRHQILAQIKATSKGITTADLALKLGIERHTLTKYLEVFKTEGLIEERTFGRTKVWTPAQSPILTLLDRNDQVAQSIKGLFGALDEQIHIVDAHKNLLWANKDVSTRSGITIAHAPTCHKFLKGENEFCHNCPAEKTFKTGAKHKAFDSLIAPDGSQHVFEIHTSPIKDETGAIVAVLEVVKEV